MLTLLLFAIIIVCVAMLWNEGLWGNAISLVNVVIAALIATNYFEPLAATIEGLGSQMESYTYLWDFLSIWAIFVFAFGVMRTVTDKLTKTKVKFKLPIEHAGRIILAFAVGYVMMSFACFTLHLAPLAEHPFGGEFQRAQVVQSGPVVTPSGDIFESDKRLPSHFLFLAPDRQWLSVVYSRSARHGALSRWWGIRPFDEHARFLFKYEARRRELEEYNRKRGAMRVDFSQPN